MSEKVLKELIKNRNELKKKFRSIRLGEVDTYDKLEDTFRPITRPLKKFIDESNKNLLTSKKELSEMSNDYSHMFDKIPMKMETSTPKRLSKMSETFAENMTSKNNSEDNKFYTQSTITENDELNNTMSVMNLSDLGRKNMLDTLYGPHKDENTGEWMFGDSPIKLSEDKIKIGNQSWARTHGLFELLFYIEPTQYDKTDLDIYKKILEKTNAYRRNYKVDGQIKGTRAYKYKNIISDLLKHNKSGRGMMKLNSQKPNYLYWDDPNELVDRLRLLIASQAAGHTNHNNEIVSIIEELKEANIIV